MSYTYLHFTDVDKTPLAEDHDPMFPSAARVLNYIQTLHNRHSDYLVLNTTLERAVKQGNEWRLTLRRADKETDYWYEESFDALVVATGIYSVPRIPDIPGLRDYNRSFPGRALHSKYFRSVEGFKDRVSLAHSGLRREGTLTIRTNSQSW
jgi:cation diffusion facilitator CzcD-associated flavoprotein CzcO